jgi:outer membrane protein assembly factor BamB
MKLNLLHKSWLKSFIILVLLASFLPANSFAKKQKKNKSAGLEIIDTAWTEQLKAGSPKKRFFPEESQITLDSGFIYVGTHAGLFYKVNAADGKVVWEYENIITGQKDENPIASQAGIFDGLVIFTDINGYVTALNTSDGTLAWQKFIAREALGNVLIMGDKAYFMRGESHLVCISAMNGNQIWSRELPGYVPEMSMRGHASLVTDSTKIYLGMANGSVLAFQAGSGSVSWVKQLSVPLSSLRDIDSSLTLVGSELYVSGYFNKTYRMRTSDGSLVWRGDGGSGGAPLVLDDKVIIASSRGEIKALNRADGEEVWSFKYQKKKLPIVSAPALIDPSHILSVSSDGKGFVLNVEDGSFSQEISVSSGAIRVPVNDMSRTYLISSAGKLYAWDHK